MIRLSLLLFLALFFTAIFSPLTSVRADDDDSSSSSPPSPPSSDSPSVSADPFTPEQRNQIAASEEKHEFQAEVHRLMDIIINSLYSKREIFVRELISNAADALDKIRYLSLTNQTSIGEGESAKLEIKIAFDRDAKTLTFTDTGVGMTKQELIKNLGIVAKSGTSEFVSEASKGTDALALIGQFGVGFYSVYLAADKVTVISKNNNDHQYIWESTADRTFTISEDPRGNTLGRGTSVILHLKEDAQQEFLNDNEIKKIVSRYSEFINYPIYLHVSKNVDKEVPVEEETKPEKTEEEKETEKEKKEEEDGEGEELEVSEEDEADKKPKTKTVRETVWDWERLNDVKAIWTRNPKDITDEEYQSFYKALTKDEQPFLNKIHFTAEGEITFRAILYVPQKAPAGMYDKFYERSTALKLYVRRVLISDEFDDFLPRYLNFIKGVVDSEDLPLNVSRETLAQSRVLKVMAKKLTRKVLEMLKKMSDDQEKKKGDKSEDGEDEAAKEEEEKKDGDDEKKAELYGKFWDSFGKSIKLGVIDDRANRAKLSKLLRFHTSKSEGKAVSLESYVERMPAKQKFIYFITGESLDSVKNSPFLERLNKKGYEVVYMVDPLDEYLVQSLSEFDGTTLMSITKEGLKLDDDEKERLEKYKEEFKPLTDWLKGTYGSKVEKVTVSNRIAKSPMVLVTGQYGWSSNMERIMAAQTFANSQDSSYMLSKKTLEINPLHPIIKELKAKVEADPSDKTFIDLANLLYDATLLQSGFVHKEPNDFATRIHRVVSNGLNLDPNAEAEDEPESEEKGDSETEAEKSSEEESASESHDHEEL